MRLVSFLSCLRPCCLDHVIQLVHLNGRVEHMSRPVKVADVMHANPQYIVGQPSSPSVVGHRTAVLPPDAELELGQIYFLLPTPIAQISSVDSDAPSSLRTTILPKSTSARSTGLLEEVKNGGTLNMEDYDVVAKLSMSKECLAEFLSQKEDLDRFIADERKQRNESCNGIEAAMEMTGASLFNKRMYTGGRSWRPVLESIVEVT